MKGDLEMEEAVVRRPPELTVAERKRNLERAMAARRERGLMLAAVKRGEADPRGVLLRRDPVALRTRVRAFVMSWPGYGAARADALIGRLGISPARRLGGLGSRQRAALMDAAPAWKGGGE